MGKEAERAPRGPLTSRRTRRPPAGRARTRAPAPGGNPCREARPGRLRGCARGPGWGAGRGGEARSPPRQPRGAAAAAAAPATLGAEPCGAQPEQVCCAASRAPSGSLPAREALQGEPRRLRGGAGGARALHSSPSWPRARGEGAWPLRWKLAGGGAAGKQRLLGASQAGRAPDWEESCKPGLGKESRVLSRKG